MKIGELSRQSGVSVRMLRYYESEGLLAPARTDSGYREYDAVAVETLKRIRMLTSAGLKLDTISLLLPCVRSAEPTFEPCSELRAILRQQVELLDARMTTLADSRLILSRFLSATAGESAERS